MGRSQFLAQTICMNRSCSAESDNRDDFWIASLFRNMGLGCCSHGFVDEIMNSPNGLYKWNAQRLGNLFLHTPPCCLLVKLHLTAEEVVFVKVPQQKIG